MKIGLTHQTRFDYTHEVIDGVMDVRLGPLSDEHQRWAAWTLSATPNAAVRAYTDGFGNAAHLVTVRKPHAHVAVESHGEIETLLLHPFAAPARAPRPLSNVERVDYLAPSPLVAPDPRLRDLAADCPAGDPFEAVQCMMGVVAR